jgi:hypothetical protein
MRASTHIVQAFLSNWPRPWWVVIVVALVYLALVVTANSGDPLALATLGTRFSEGDPEGSEGYDGQFVYYIAIDPLNGWQRCDVPAYRYQRILYPLLARALALGKDGAIPFALPLINLIALGAGTWLAERVLCQFGMSRWYAITYGLYAGQLMSVRLDLNEPLAHALVLAAILSLERNRWGGGLALFALAALAKETTLVFTGGYLLYLLACRQWKHATWLTLGVGIPFVVWQAVLWAWLGRPGIGSGGAGATSWEVIPYRGLWSVGTIDMRVLGLLALIMVPLAVIPSLAGLWATARDLYRGRWHPYTTMLLANCLVMLFLPQSTYREPLAMLRLTSGLVIAMILYGACKHSKRTLNYTLLWLASLVFVTREGPTP